MLNELSNDPIQTAIAQLEKQHEADKKGNYTSTKKIYYIWVEQKLYKNNHLI